MTIQEVSQRLIRLCSEGKFLDAQHELYDKNILSIETDGSKTTGSSNMHAKEQRFLDGVAKIRMITFSEPLITGNFFSVILKMEVDLKNGGSRSLEEICVYRVREGKIVFEQFFS